MDEQSNDQVQAVRQDVKGLKDQLANILGLLSTGRGKTVAENSSQVEAVFVNDRVSTPIAENGKKVAEEQGSRRRLEFLEERLRGIEGANMYRNIDATQPCLISDVVIPFKFKTPDFEKYNGTCAQKLDGSQYRWKDLTNSFLKQYKYNVDMALDHLDLQRMRKKSVETFKKYAQRWRELAAQVQSPLTDKDLTTMFINTL
ncbi:Gag-pro-like protein [Cucumis melo var. makuwa]|uniref:Gag-pro-like protein n=1 Tax=Cucumis melo var. makuwa TaxID=1194695 RepID=A0A5D3D3R9_CUCMM|nr:Gag-pro-like protein [Cucumis melo var. makuwa]TYK17899.1 Gag-pro-like protein [Cucumis melo var. makuwa]